MTKASSPFFGELYLRSTRPFLSERVTEKEVAYLASTFAGLRGTLLDVGCGHGRHAVRLKREAFQVVGVEKDALSLFEREGDFLAIRADMRQLPFASASLSGMYAWYSSLFVFDDAEHPPLLKELARVLLPGAKLVFHTVPPWRLADSPRAHFRTTLPDGSRLEETSSFSLQTGRDEALRRLELPDGRVLSATYAIRYYQPAELMELLQAAGFSVIWMHGSLDGSSLEASSADLIVGAERRHG